MNHKQNAIRFAVVVFWLIYFGILASAAVNLANAITLGWPTLLLYGTVITVVTYANIFSTKYFWNLK